MKHKPGRARLFVSRETGSLHRHKDVDIGKTSSGEDSSKSSSVSYTINRDM